MTQRIPDSPDMEAEDQIPSFSRDIMPAATSEEEIMELTWQGGPVMVHRSSKRNSSAGGSSQAVIPAEQPVATEFRPIGEQQHTFIQEVEMATWLQHNLDSSFDHDLFADLIYSAPPPPHQIAPIAPPPPIAAIDPRKREILPRLPNFPHFARFDIGPRIEPTVSEPLVITAVEGEMTVVESNETPDLGQNSTVTQTTAAEELATGTCELTMGSSAGGSVANYTASLILAPQNPENPAGVAVDRKGKAKESFDDPDDSQSEDIRSDSEAVEAKKQGRGGPVSKKRQRVAEVHNLSERKRRDRINEKIRTLQELVPGCNKLEKASILDDTIEYLKSLQMQVQMMSMGCGMIPMMYPGMQQQYMPPIGMGMGMNRPILPYPTMLPPSSTPNPAQTVDPSFSVPALNPLRIQASSNQTDLLLSLLAGFSPSQQPMPNIVNPYQQFLALQQAQVSSPQNQGLGQPSGNKPSSSKDIGNPENRQTGP